MATVPGLGRFLSQKRYTLSYNLQNQPHLCGTYRFCSSCFPLPVLNECVIRFCYHGEGQRKHGSPPKGASNLEVSFVSLGQSQGEVQAQPCATIDSALRVVNLLKGLKDMLELVLLNANPCKDSDAKWILSFHSSPGSKIICCSRLLRQQVTLKASQPNSYLTRILHLDQHFLSHLHGANRDCPLGAELGCIA